MKYIFFLIFSLSTLLVYAYDCVVGGIYYNLNRTNRSSEVTYCKEKGGDYSGVVIIPSYIEYGGVKYSVTQIGMRAFAESPQLEEVVIPNSVRSIGAYSFSGCTALKNVSLSSRLKVLSQFCFEGCKSLRRIDLPGHVDSLGYHCFLSCTGLSEIEIPQSVKHIGDGCFMNCTSLPVSDGIRYAGTCAVQVADKNQASYTIRKGTRFIHSYAFAKCTRLVSLDIPESVCEIGVAAFSSCSSLREVKLSNRISDLQNLVFAGCKNLKFVAVPKQVRSIGNMAFAGCSDLSEVTLSSVVKEIGEGAFMECSSLSKIQCAAKNPPFLKENALDKVDFERCTLVVTKGCIRLYQNSPDWQKFRNVQSL